MNNTSNNNEDECGYLECYSLGVENVPMKVDEDMVITILACGKYETLRVDMCDSVEITHINCVSIIPP